MLLKIIGKLEVFHCLSNPKTKRNQGSLPKTKLCHADNAYQKLKLFQRKVMRKTKSNKTNVKVNDPFVDAVSYFGNNMKLG